MTDAQQQQLWGMVFTAAVTLVPLLVAWAKVRLQADIARSHDGQAVLSAKLDAIATKAEAECIAQAAARDAAAKAAADAAAVVQATQDAAQHGGKP